MIGNHGEIPIYTKKGQELTISDEKKSIILKNSDGKRIIEISESNKIISIKNLDPNSKIEIDSVGEIKLKGTKITLEATEDIVIGPDGDTSLYTFLGL